MPNIDDLFEKHSKEIAEESLRFKEAMQTEIPRDPLRRPWNDSSGRPSIDSTDVRHERRDDRRQPATEAPLKVELPWYATFWSFVAAVKKNQTILLKVFAFAGLISIVAAQFVPIIYNSSLQLFAPDKVDKISSRLQLFANRVEFASFPTDLKIPLGLIVRRLKSPVATAWVLEKYQTRPSSVETPISPTSVQAETFYAEGSELLTIQGYANNPKAAVEITNLYWDYFEKEVSEMRTEHLQKVDEWIQLTSVELERKLADIAGQTGKLAALAPGAEQSHIQSRLSDSYADILMRKIRVQKEHDELQKALQQKSLDVLFKVNDPEVQDAHRIYEALETQSAATPNQRFENQKLEIKRRVEETVATNLEQKNVELDSLESEIKKIKPRLSSIQTVALSGDPTGLKMQELFRQQAQYQSQLDEIENLKAQIKVESDISESRLKPIQAAIVDPSTGRPYRAVIYLVCLFASLLVTLIALMIVQIRKPPGLLN